VQAVDGLHTSEYLNELVIKNIEGEFSLDEVNTLLEKYYLENDERSRYSEEADKVSKRITKILSEKVFTFSVMEMLSIHRKLFDGIYDHAGMVRTYNMFKKECI